MKKPVGYHTITYRFRLDCPEKEWLYKTKEIYNLVLNFYYEILQKEPELLSLSSQQALRQLELMTIGAKGQEKTQVKYPIPYEKVPVYFRRAAINDAIRLNRSYLSGKEQGAKPAKGFHASPIYYKGMYKEFTSTTILLKLWNGKKWTWKKCGVNTCGRAMPEPDQILSPVLKIDGKKTMLHVPIIEEVQDIRTIKERFKTEEKICAVAFPNQDSLAVLVVLRRDGSLEKSFFIRGGRELSHKRRLLLNQIQRNQSSMGNKKECSLLEENKHLKQKIRNLTDYYAHKVSREIVAFCVEHQIHLIVVPAYKEPLHLNQIGYISATDYDWIGRRMIEYLRYKAFGKGIVVTSVSTKGIAGTCYLCGAEIKRFNANKKPNKNYYGGKNYICPNGHGGNAALNSAMNVGKKFLKSYAEM